MRYGDNADYWQILSKMLRAKAKRNRMQELWFYHYAWDKALKEYRERYNKWTPPSDSTDKDATGVMSDYNAR
jgi:hypothetical protein